MAFFKIFSDKFEKHTILIKFDDKIEFVSQDYGSRTACLKMIGVIRKNAGLDAAYEMKNLSCGSWCFIMKNVARDEIIGRSETYVHKAIVEEKMALMKVLVPKAKIDSEAYTI